MDAIQIALPVDVRPDEIERKKTFGAAIELCAEIGGFDLDKQSSSAIQVDKAQFSRWKSDQDGIKWGKLERLMDACGNDVPVLWMLARRNYDLNSLRKRESEVERENRLLREENAALRRALKEPA